MNSDSIESKNALHEACLNAWVSSIHAGNFQKAVEIDFHHYAKLVKPSEDKNFWDRWQRETYSYRLKLSEHFIKKFPSLKNSTSNSKLLIVHHNFSGLAHETQLARNLSYLKNMKKGVDFDVLYLFGEPLKDFHIIENIYGLKKSNIHFLNAKSYVDAAEKLNTFTNSSAYTAILYPSIFFMAFWMSIFVRHPNQKFLTLKYFPLQAGRIKNWACIRRTETPNLTVQDQNFIQLSLLDLNVAGLAPEHLVRSPITFGSISRREKTTDLTYNKFVSEKLHLHSDLIYLYTDKDENSLLEQEQIKNNPKTLNLGWVDPAKGIGEFSIYLEPFPWGGGEMSFLAINSGIPYLTLDTPENRSVGIYLTLELISKSGSEILNASFSESLEKLSSTFDELVTNKDFRESLGVEWKNAASKYEPINPSMWHDFLTQ